MSDKLIILRGLKDARKNARFLENDYIRVLLKDFGPLRLDDEEALFGLKVNTGHKPEPKRVFTYIDGLLNDKRFPYSWLLFDMACNIEGDAVEECSLAFRLADTIPSGFLKGYVPIYKNEKLNADYWIPAISLPSFVVDELLDSIVWPED